MKPGVFTQMYIQLVFAVKNREALIFEEHQDEVYRYVSSILSNLKHKSIIINGMPDHIHILFGLNPSISISDTVWELKRSSSMFINKKNWYQRGQFYWQDGYGGFSYSKSQIDHVYNYIKNQKEHHKRLTFKEEYINFLKEYGLDFDPKFLFDFFG